MSSADNFPFSKITKSTQEFPSLGIDNGELIDVQSVVASAGTISVFDDSESALDDANSVSMVSMKSSMHRSLDWSSSLQGSLHSSRQSLNLTVQSLTTSHLTNNDEENDKIKEQELRRKEKILCKVQYAMYSLLSILCAFIVMIIWYTSWLEENTIINEIGDKQTEINANLTDLSFKCQFWHIVGDGFCDDEANTVECGYDLKDCCQMGNDRTLCEDCLCFVSDDKKASIEENYFKSCSSYVPQHLGNHECDLNQNNEDHYFDMGDCCLEDISCRIKFFNGTDYVKTYCPLNPCIKSNIFCVHEELGNGYCEDYNNGPYCDYDLGDCCLYGANYGPPTSTKPPSKVDCCTCACKQALLHPTYMNLG